MHDFIKNSQTPIWLWHTYWTSFCGMSTSRVSDLSDNLAYTTAFTFPGQQLVAASACFKLLQHAPARSSARWEPAWSVLCGPVAGLPSAGHVGASNNCLGKSWANVALVADATWTRRAASMLPVLQAAQACSIKHASVSQRRTPCQA
jgi:hypothetical protein